MGLKTLIIASVMILTASLPTASADDVLPPCDPEVLPGEGYNSVGLNCSGDLCGVYLEPGGHSSVEYGGCWNLRDWAYGVLEDQNVLHIIVGAVGTVICTVDNDCYIDDLGVACIAYYDYPDPNISIYLQC